MRLIDADDLIVMGFDAPDDEHRLMFVPYEFIEEADTIDAVEVVRCRDCKWYEIAELKVDGTPDKRFSKSFCDLHSRYRKPDYFCADGERRTDERVDS